jgi:hypothetical protein
MTILSRDGLGDVVCLLPVCYHFAAQGQEVNLCIEGAKRSLEYLPTLTPIGQEREGDELDFTSLDWNVGRDFWADACMKRGVWPAILPAFPTLREVPSMVDGEYVVVIPQGAESYKVLDPEVIRAVCREHRAVVLDGERGDWPDLNLTGQTTIADLCGLICHAKAVVTPDSGPLHIAAAYQVPTVCVYGPTISPWVFGRYTSVRWLHSEYVAEVDPEWVLWALERTLKGKRLTEE